MRTSASHAVALQVIATVVFACGDQGSSWAWQGRELRGGGRGAGGGTVGGSGGVYRVYHRSGSSGGVDGTWRTPCIVGSILVGSAVLGYACYRCGPDVLFRFVYLKKARSCLSAGHPLSYVNAMQIFPVDSSPDDSYRHSWICDLCNTRSYNKTETFGHCYHCGMDFCQICLQQQRESSVEMGTLRTPMVRSHHVRTPMMAQSCLSSGHPLSDVTAMQMYHQDPSLGDLYRHSWICDLCTTRSYNKIEAFSHCYKCGVDFCQPCLRQQRESSVEKGTVRTPMVRSHGVETPMIAQTMMATEPPPFFAGPAAPVAQPLTAVAQPLTAVAQPVVDGISPSIDAIRVEPLVSAPDGAWRSNKKSQAHFPLLEFLHLIDIMYGLGAQRL